MIDDLTENEIQRNVFKHLRTRGAPGIFAFHPKNASSDMRGRGRGIHVGLGVEPGVPDIIVMRSLEVGTLVYGLELKRLSRKGKKRTDHEEKQLGTRQCMESVNVITGVAFGLDDALAWLERYGLLRGTTS